MSSHPETYAASGDVPLVSERHGHGVWLIALGMLEMTEILGAWNIGIGRRTEWRRYVAVQGAPANMIQTHTLLYCTASLRVSSRREVSHEYITETSIR